MAHFKPLLTLLVLALLSGFFATGCGDDFDPVFLITEQRVLAVVAQPPQAKPGQNIRLTPLVVDQNGTLQVAQDYAANWWRCPTDATDPLSDGLNCDIDTQAKPLASQVPFDDVIPQNTFVTATQNQGVLSTSLSASPLSQADLSLLAPLLGYQRVVGLSAQNLSVERRNDAIKHIVVFPDSDAIDSRIADLDPWRSSEGADIPNHNPILFGVTVHEDSPNGPLLTSVPVGKPIWFKPNIDLESFESYFSVKVDLSTPESGTDDVLAGLDETQLHQRLSLEQQCEIPTLSWFVTAGALRQEVTVDERVLDLVYPQRGVTCPGELGPGELGPANAGPNNGSARRLPQVRYVAPDTVPGGGIVHGWMVLRDGRGGTAFTEFSFEVVE